MENKKLPEFNGVLCNVGQVIHCFIVYPETGKLIEFPSFPIVSINDTSNHFKGLVDLKETELMFCKYKFVSAIKPYWDVRSKEVKDIDQMTYDDFRYGYDFELETFEKKYEIILNDKVTTTSEAMAQKAFDFVVESFFITSQKNEDIAAS